MRKPNGVLLAVPLLCSLASCASAPVPSAGSAVDGGAIATAIVLCSTTLSELRSKLGEPSRDGLLHRDRIVSWITDWGSPLKYLAVLLDDRGVVTDLYWNIPTEIPWAPSSQCSRP